MPRLLPWGLLVILFGKGFDVIVELVRLLVLALFYCARYLFLITKKLFLVNVLG